MPWLIGDVVHLVGGGSLVTAFYLLTDPVTAPFIPGGELSLRRSRAASPWLSGSTRRIPMAPHEDQTVTNDIGSLRRHDERGQLRLGDLSPDPMAQFKRWFDDASEEGILEPNAMSLATASPAGDTTLRTVLLKGYSEEGFLFFTNLESTKAKQIAENPHVSLLFPWIALQRQVIVNGTATRVALTEVARDFFSRPRERRSATWVPPQSRIIDARRLLEAKFEEMLRKFGAGEIPIPSYWGGFRVTPRTIEFWQAGPHRLHDRFVYSRDGAGWTIAPLAP